mmetsp:Transcript_45131/g.141400  ORF Transcript_45131/g.141400 Transcript_45131/m.141400 type:complete len:335 (+) Transcript_45131:245-1249(+)
MGRVHHTDVDAHDTRCGEEVEGEGRGARRHGAGEDLLRGRDHAVDAAVQAQGQSLRLPREVLLQGTRTERAQPLPMVLLRRRRVPGYRRHRLRHLQLHGVGVHEVPHDAAAAGHRYSAAAHARGGLGVLRLLRAGREQAIPHEPENIHLRVDRRERLHRGAASHPAVAVRRHHAALDNLPLQHDADPGAAALAHGNGVHGLLRRRDFSIGHAGGQRDHPVRADVGELRRPQAEDAGIVLLPGLPLQHGDVPAAGDAHAEPPPDLSVPGAEAPARHAASAHGGHPELAVAAGRDGGDSQQGHAGDRDDLQRRHGAVLHHRQVRRDWGQAQRHGGR